MEQTPQMQEESLSGDELLSQEARVARWQARRPNVDHLKEGIAQVQVADFTEKTTVVLFDIGDRIVVDCRTDLLAGHPWLETIVGKCRSIDDDTGLVSYVDEESDPRSPTVRWANFKSPLFAFKLAPPTGNPFDIPPPPKPEKPAKDPNKKGRGRPKGSKNRPKEVIKAEREARKNQKRVA